MVKEPGSHWAWSSGSDPAIILGSVGLNPLSGPWRWTRTKRMINCALTFHNELDVGVCSNLKVKQTYCPHK